MKTDFFAQNFLNYGSLWINLRRICVNEKSCQFYGQHNITMEDKKCFISYGAHGRHKCNKTN